MPDPTVDAPGQYWADGPGGGTPLSATNINARETRLVATTYNVRDYGAVGNGTADDTSAFQAAITAACAASGTVLIPRPSANYKITSTLVITPPSGSQVFMNIIGESPLYYSIAYSGTGPCFQSTGWKRSTIQNVRIRLADSTTGAQGWDIDGDASHFSTSHLTFINCDVTGATPTNPIGFILGNRSSGVTGVDISFIDWINCDVGFDSVNGGVGWASVGTNSLVHRWFGCSTSFCSAGWTNSANSKSGNAGMWLYGIGGGFNDVDLRFTASEGSFGLWGGRFEHGKRLLDLAGSGGRQSKLVTIDNIIVGAYAPADNIVFNAACAAHITVQNSFFYPTTSTNFTAAFVTVTTGSSGYGSVAFRDCHLAANDPFVTVSAGNWKVTVDGCSKMVSGTDFQTTAFFQERSTSASVPSVASAGTLTLPFGRVVTVTGTTGITSITARPAGDVVTLIFSGILTVTDGSNLKLSANFTTSADDSLTLVSDGTNWIEVSRSAN